MNEIRQDPVTGRRVIISTHRDARPNEFSCEVATPLELDTSAAACPFCAGQMQTPPMVARFGESNNRSWQVCVVPNLYPVLEMPAEEPATNDAVLFSSQPARGHHEVVIESPTHVTRMSELSLEQIVLMLRAYRDRMLFMRAQPDVVYVQAMKNSGLEAGASLKHTHSQLFGLNFVPQQIQDELDGAKAYWETSGRCLFCDMAEQESKAGKRVVVETNDFIAWCPFASRFAFETCVAPKAHTARFETCDNRMLEKLGALFQIILRRIERHPRITAFNYLIHSLPFDSDRDDHYHWHIEIIPRIAKQAGFEWGTGVLINTVAPERAASELRINLDDVPGEAS